MPDLAGLGYRGPWNSSATFPVVAETLQYLDAEHRSAKRLRAGYRMSAIEHRETQSERRKPRAAVCLPWWTALGRRREHTHWLGQTEQGDLIDYLDEMKPGYVRTDVGGRLTFVFEPIVRSGLDRR